VNRKKIAVQDLYAPRSICFGCGPNNKEGLHIKSHVKGDSLICTWIPREKYQAFPGILNGGIIGSLLDCHSNWTAAYFIMKDKKWVRPHCTVTAYFKVSLKRPTSILAPVYLKARVMEIQKDRATINATLISEKKICAECEGLFVAVKKGHPAFHRWN